MHGSGRLLGLYWGAVAFASALAAPLAPQAAALMPPCLFRSVTGLPCPTCGGAHAMVALARLDLAGAVASNPLLAAAGVAFTIGGLFAGAAAIAGRPLREPTRYGVAVRLVALLAVVLNWIWVIVHSPLR